MSTTPSRTKPAATAESGKLPPRRTSHPSQKGVWTRRFIQLLLFLFAALVITLAILYQVKPELFEQRNFELLQ